MERVLGSVDARGKMESYSSSFIRDCNICWSYSTLLVLESSVVLVGL